MLLQTAETPWWSYLLNVLWIIFIFITMFYGQQIQSWRASKTITTALEELKKWDKETRATTIRKLKQYCDKNLTLKDLEEKLDIFLNYISISPTS